LSAGVARTAVMAATRIAEVASEVERWGGDEQPPQRGRGRWRRCDLRSRDLRALVYFWQQADTFWESWQRPKQLRGLIFGLAIPADHLGPFGFFSFAG
jgi:hypothetical protein